MKDIELFSMFNVRIAPQDGGEPFWLWSVKTKRQPKLTPHKGEKRVVDKDHARPPLKRGKPGSRERIETYRQAVADGEQLFID